MPTKAEAEAATPTRSARPETREGRAEITGRAEIPLDARVLARAIGNRAFARIAVARENRTIRGERVRVASDAEAAEAERIMKRIKRRYGISLKSGELVGAVKADYSTAPPGELKKVKKRHWTLRELRALDRACRHYAPILGKRRAKSTRAGDAQEVVLAGKATTSITEDDPTATADPDTLGEYFASARAFGMFKSGENESEGSFDVDQTLELTATHELAHGLMEPYLLNTFVNSMDFWLDEDTPSGDATAEAPVNSYAGTNAAEDLCESVAFYFVDRNALKTKCPERYKFIRRAVKAWKPVPAPTGT